MIMSEDEKQEKIKREKDVKIIWVDGIPCMELSQDSIMKKGQNNSVNHPFTFGCLQESKASNFLPDIHKELEKLFNTPFFPAKWKIYEINQWGEVKELKDEDEKDDNAK